MGESAAANGRKRESGLSVHYSHLGQGAQATTASNLCPKAHTALQFGPRGDTGRGGADGLHGRNQSGSAAAKLAL